MTLPLQLPDTPLAMRIRSINALATAATAALITAATACSAASDSSAGIITGYDDETPAEEIRGSVKNISLMQLETAPGCILQSVGKLVMEDSVIFVSDFDNLYSFDLSGKFLMKYGGKGNAENEYINLATFMLDPEGNVVIVDSYSGKLLTFSRDGGYIGCDRLDPELLRYVHDGAFTGSDTVFFSNYLYNDSHIAYTTVDLKARRKVGEVRCALATANTMVPVGRHPFSLAEGKSAVEYILPFATEIYSTDGAPVYDIQTAQRVIPEADLSEISDFSIMTYAKAMEDGDFMGFTDIFESDGQAILMCWNIGLTMVDKPAGTCRHWSLKSSDLPFTGLRYVNGSAGISAMMPYEIMPEAWDEFRTNYDITRNLEIDRDKNPVVIFFDIDMHP